MEIYCAVPLKNVDKIDFSLLPNFKNSENCKTFTKKLLQGKGCENQFSVPISKTPILKRLCLISLQIQLQHDVACQTKPGET